MTSHFFRSPNFSVLGTQNSLLPWISTALLTIFLRKDVRFTSPKFTENLFKDQTTSLSLTRIHDQIAINRFRPTPDEQMRSIYVTAPTSFAMRPGSRPIGTAIITTTALAPGEVSCKALNAFKTDYPCKSRRSCKGNLLKNRHLQKGCCLNK